MSVALIRVVVVTMVATLSFCHEESRGRPAWAAIGLATSSRRGKSPATRLQVKWRQGSAQEATSEQGSLKGAGVGRGGGRWPNRGAPGPRGCHEGARLGDDGWAARRPPRRWAEVTVGGASIDPPKEREEGMWWAYLCAKVSWWPRAAGEEGLHWMLMNVEAICMVASRCMKQRVVQAGTKYIRTKQRLARQGGCMSVGAQRN